MALNRLSLLLCEQIINPAEKLLLPEGTMGSALLVRKKVPLGRWVVDVEVVLQCL
jgi:hypothetical protein